MNLTNLRRLVLAADVAALAAAGAAAWYSLQAAPVAPKDWTKLFPVRTAQPADMTASTPAPKEQYTGAVNYAQGDKPVVVAAGPAAEVVKVDDFLTRYRLNGIFLGWDIGSSYAQLQTGPK